MQFTAHPKVDQRTGEMFAFGYDLNKAPYLSVTTFDTKGALTNDVAVTLRRPIMMHDCAITQVGCPSCRLPSSTSGQPVVLNTN